MTGIRETKAAFTVGEIIKQKAISALYTKLPASKLKGIEDRDKPRQNAGAAVMFPERGTIPDAERAVFAGTVGYVGYFAIIPSRLLFNRIYRSTTT